MKVSKDLKDGEKYKTSLKKTLLIFLKISVAVRLQFPTGE